MLYTVVLDYRGGTYISQVNAGSVAGALKIWADALDIGAVARLGPQRKGELIDDIKMQLSSGQPPAPLDGLVNAWCASALTSGGLSLINIVGTISQKASRSRSIRKGK